MRPDVGEKRASFWDSLKVRSKRESDTKYSARWRILKITLFSRISKPYSLEVLGSCIQFMMKFFFTGTRTCTFDTTWNTLLSGRCYAWNISSRSIWRRITRKSQACSHAISSATFYLTLLATRKESRAVHAVLRKKCRHYRNRAKHSTIFRPFGSQNKFLCFGF